MPVVTQKLSRRVTEPRYQAAQPRHPPMSRSGAGGQRDGEISHMIIKFQDDIRAMLSAQGATYLCSAWRNP
ncbi:MAG: hypothetical protein A4S15_12850 [Candidatus Raskinella chloraquaticus]|uniref:Uncharacterized protein n=1 Tax=Candidatus Raskinella chloraquaticus TaxID=1951219 RepID=A0A1W9HUG1_9HYPH|nr:MAG: hypothetical protein A4S15_12850 [Proteobacteria bacterium SG_bin8]